ncbi:GNAT family N-acetyltransferase [Algoriphagus sp. A40]|uniref:GNAT family N-acetyltransferase n=1 Tax=Algoriphagus sp. A40 TaxID=1945863 RepID=UPI000986B0A8|nr:GNAT family N-acetyltransferase [Algoriphagus sp. A40]OOG77202.1 hypothetical protein B0E43_06305 [Algoriphagus sp. A40]
MIIRKSNESDIPQIIELLKVSLGENLIPKSEKLWQWKHEANPFGKSPILLAEEKGTLVGVRAFLRWDFSENGKIIKACRAVDTATHPDHQGKGIFQKLTLSLIEEIKNQGINLIYNTPNSKSTPGYLKMGWEKWGKLPLKLNFHLATSGKMIPVLSDWSRVENLIERIESYSQQNIGISTRILPGYLLWRFRDNPLFQYQFLSDGESYLLIYRTKEGKMGREFRICDLFTTGQLTDNQTNELKNSLNQRIKSSGARFSSFSGLIYPNQKVLEMGMLPVLNIGPLVTLRKLHDKFIPMNQSWNWSLGDLEVF